MNMTCLQTCHIHINACMFLVLSNGTVHWRCCDSRCPPADLATLYLTSAQRDKRSPSWLAALHILVVTCSNLVAIGDWATEKFFLQYMHICLYVCMYVYSCMHVLCV